MNPQVTEREMRFKGLPISEGVVRARVYVIEAETGVSIPLYTVDEAALEGEKERLRAALKLAVIQLDEIAVQVAERIGPSQANIFMAQKMMVEDVVLVEEIMQAITQSRMNAEAAVDRTLDGYESVLAEVDDEYLSERASDIGEIRRRLLDNLRQAGVSDPSVVSRTTFDLDEVRVIVARELTPSETVALDPEFTAGFLTERGGAGSHAAILARAMGIPAVSGIPRIHKKLTHGQEVLLNGTTGEVVLWPTAATLGGYPSIMRKRSRKMDAIEPVENLQVLANISLSTELQEVEDCLAEGIGLYRTEIEFLAMGRALTEDEQYARYAKVAKAMAGKPFYVRLLDLGGDKAATFLNMPTEENPCLGYRGARLLMGESELLIPQVRALARASAHGPIHIMYPMIVDVKQFLTLRALVAQHIEDLPHDNVQHGVMFEVPSACLEATELFAMADFACIGTNDLIQYLFAVDRNNDKVAYDYNPDKPVFWNLLKKLADAAKAAGKPLSLCGEIGGEPRYVPKLMELGIRTVSVSPRLVGMARLAARGKAR